MSAVAASDPPSLKVNTRSRRDQMLLVAMFVLVAVVVAYLLAWKPQSAALSRAHDERADVEAQLAAVPAVAVTDDADGAAAVAEAAAAQLLTAVPANIATPDVLRLLDGLATDMGVDLGDITLAEPALLAASPSAVAVVPTDAATGATAGGAVALSMTLSVTGDAASTAAFVAGLAALPRLVVVDQVTIQTTVADAATGTPAHQAVQVSARVFATAA